MSKTGIQIKLVGEDGNAFAILGRCRKELLIHGSFTKDLWEEFKKEAMSGDYDHLLQTVMKYFDVE